MSFSIIIPVHRSESRLEECLESVFQSLEGDEIVLIENGTSDSYWEICINYNDTHPVKERVKKRFQAFFHSERFCPRGGADIL